MCNQFGQPLTKADKSVVEGTQVCHFTVSPLEGVRIAPTRRIASYLPQVVYTMGKAGFTAEGWLYGSPSSALIKKDNLCYLNPRIMRGN